MFRMSDGQLATPRPDSIVTTGCSRFTILSPRLIRMEWSDTGEFVDHATQVVTNRDFAVPKFTVTHDASGLEIQTDYLRLHHDGGPFSASGLSVTLARGASDEHYATWRFGQSPPQNLPHRGNLLGTARTLDEVDGACELDPGLLATYGFATLDDSTSVLLTDDGWIAPRPGAGDENSCDIYLFAHGRDYKAALEDFHRLTGQIPLVPRYVLGNWWSRYWAYSDSEYLAVMDRFREEEIPLSVAVIDMDWHLTDIDPEIGTGWTGYTWNRELFPDPPAFLRALHDRGLAVTLNVHPADGVRRHEERYPEMARALGIDPDSGEQIEFDVTSRRFVDAYLKHLHHPLEEQGVDFWWIDWQSGATTRVPGLDPLWMLNHIHYNDSGRDGKRPLTFSRYAGPGSHRYPVGFSGDTIVTWDSLDFQPYFTATAANIGYPWWSNDIGGHMFGSFDVERSVRWFQLGVFSPVNRLHSGNGPFSSKEPWIHGGRAHQIMARFLRLRHRLVPYLYTAAWCAHTDQVSLVRPMYHEYPEDENAYLVKNQALVGECLLLAPITSPEDPYAHVAAVDVWLPEGNWFDVFTGNRYSGGRRLKLHRPMELTPVLARAGAVIPLQHDPMADVSKSPDVLDLRVFPGTCVSHLSEDQADGIPTLPDRRLTVFEQWLSPKDGVANLVLVCHPTTGVQPGETRTINVDVVGVSSVECVEFLLGEETAASPTAVKVSDELLSTALRFELGEVDLSAGFELILRGARPEVPDVVSQAAVLLQAAEIPFVDKEAALHAVQRLTGLALVEELGTIPIKPVLRAALIEIAAKLSTW